jgi:hypothetical protein
VKRRKKRNARFSIPYCKATNPEQELEGCYSCKIFLDTQRRERAARKYNPSLPPGIKVMKNLRCRLGTVKMYMGRNIPSEEKVQEKNSL